MTLHAAPHQHKINNFGAHVQGIRGAKKADQFFRLKYYSFGVLNPHAHFHNSRTTPIVRKITESQREKSAVISGYSVLPATAMANTRTSLRPKIKVLIVQLGPILSTMTIVTFNHHPPPTTFRVDPGKLGA